MKKHPEITGRKEVRFLLLGRKSTVKYLTWFLKDHVSILASYKKEEKKSQRLLTVYIEDIFLQRFPLLKLWIQSDLAFTNFI